MTDVPEQQPARCPDRLGCAWQEHGRKHFPHVGQTRAHTRHGPARYLPGTTSDAIRSLETQTVRAPDHVLSAPPGKSEYVRDMHAVIGWDAGRDATSSFAECSGGATRGRAYHGRPMCVGNHKLHEDGDDDG
ncbi:MAG: hypothetical protein IT373_04510 [Polyangiaceae bacterium]|nr:hypothetical protein [Polyangiaceae bacterium]